MSVHSSSTYSSLPALVSVSVAPPPNSNPPQQWIAPPIPVTTPAPSALGILLLEELPFVRRPRVSNALTTFTNFGKLPVELRLAIWDKTFLPRAVEINYDTSSNQGFNSPDDVPSALLVHKESRNHALLHYPLCFGSIWHPAQTRFNLSLDILYISTFTILPHLFGIMTPVETAGLRYIAMEPGTLKHNSPSTTAAFKRIIKSLSALDELLVVYYLTKRGRSRYCDTISCSVFGNKIPDDILDKSYQSDAMLSEDWSEYLKSKAVFGWKRCTCLDMASESDTD